MSSSSSAAAPLTDEQIRALKFSTDAELNAAIASAQAKWDAFRAENAVMIARIQKYDAPSSMTKKMRDTLRVTMRITVRADHIYNVDGNIALCKLVVAMFPLYVDSGMSEVQEITAMKDLFLVTIHNFDGAIPRPTAEDLQVGVVYDANTQCHEKLELLVRTSQPTNPFMAAPNFLEVAGDLADDIENLTESLNRCHRLRRQRQALQPRFEALTVAYNQVKEQAAKMTAELHKSRQEELTRGFTEYYTRLNEEWTGSTTKQFDYANMSLAKIRSNLYIIEGRMKKYQTGNAGDAQFGELKDLEVRVGQQKILLEKDARNHILAYLNAVARVLETSKEIITRLSEAAVVPQVLEALIYDYTGMHTRQLIREAAPRSAAMSVISDRQEYYKLVASAALRPSAREEILAKRIAEILAEIERLPLPVIAYNFSDEEDGMAGLEADRQLQLSTNKIRTQQLLDQSDPYEKELELLQLTAQAENDEKYPAPQSDTRESVLRRRIAEVRRDVLKLPPLPPLPSEADDEEAQEHAKAVRLTVLESNAKRVAALNRLMEPYEFELRLLQAIDKAQTDLSGIKAELRLWQGIEFPVDEKTQLVLEDLDYTNFLLTEAQTNLDAIRDASRSDLSDASFRMTTEMLLIERLHDKVKSLAPVMQDLEAKHGRHPTDAPFRLTQTEEERDLEVLEIILNGAEAPDSDEVLEYRRRYGAPQDEDEKKAPEATSYIRYDDEDAKDLAILEELADGDFMVTENTVNRRRKRDDSDEPSSKRPRPVASDADIQRYLLPEVQSEDSDPSGSLRRWAGEMPPRTSAVFLSYPAGKDRVPLAQWHQQIDRALLDDNASDAMSQYAFAVRDAVVGSDDSEYTLRLLDAAEMNLDRAKRERDFNRDPEAAKKYVKKAIDLYNAVQDGMDAYGVIYPQSSVSN